MERVIAASIRGTFCALMLAGLAACGGGGSDDSTTPVAQQASNPTPVVSTPPASQPTTPNTQPSTPSNPPAVEPPAEPAESTEPTEPTDPVDPPPATNVAPQISGSPATEVVVGQSFNFTPSATDADGDELAFSIASKPSWASFDASTGHLWGTPAAADVGTHEEIAISVSDGAHTQALAQFAVTVVQQANGSATLAWQPPTQNTDGSALTNLKGYKIHYGTAPGSYEQTVTLDNAGVSSYVIENLAPGTYFFAISALSTNGAESDLSPEASKSI